MNFWLISFSIFLVFILVLNLILFAMNKVDLVLFWIIIIFGLVYASEILPRLNSRLH